MNVPKIDKYLDLSPKEFFAKVYERAITQKLPQEVSAEDFVIGNTVSSLLTTYYVRYSIDKGKTWKNMHKTISGSINTYPSFWETKPYMTPLTFQPLHTKFSVIAEKFSTYEKVLAYEKEQGQLFALLKEQHEAELATVKSTITAKLAM